MSAQKKEGLEGVIAASTRLSLVDGSAGRLILAGYPVEEIAPRAKFEELAHLLWYGRLPNVQELKELTADLASRRRLPRATLVSFARGRRELDSPNGRAAYGGGDTQSGALIEMPAQCGGATPHNGQQHFDVLPADSTCGFVR